MIIIINACDAEIDLFHCRAGRGLDSRGIRPSSLKTHF